MAFGFQHGITDVVGQDSYWNPVADAIGLAPHVFFDRFTLDGGAGFEQEGLDFLDAKILPGGHRAQPGAGGVEAVIGAVDDFAVEGLECGLEAEVAALTGLQGAIQRVTPRFRVAPARLSLDLAAVDLEGRGRIGLAERHHVGAEHRRGTYLLIDLPLGRELPQVGGVGQLTDQ